MTSAVGIPTSRPTAIALLAMIGFSHYTTRRHLGAHPVSRRLAKRREAVK